MMTVWQQQKKGGLPLRTASASHDGRIGFHRGTDQGDTQGQARIACNIDRIWPRNRLYVRPRDSRVHLSGRGSHRFRRALLAWYDCNRRDLPWRRTRDPYAIWLSEIMLQQTRVAAVLDHYRIFLRALPGCCRIGGGFGRCGARRLERAWLLPAGAHASSMCTRDCERNGGRFPENSERVAGVAWDWTLHCGGCCQHRLWRSRCGGGWQCRARTGKGCRPRSLLWRNWETRARCLLSKSRPGDFNQAMMELGATVCLPREPRCADCPIRRWCATQGEAPRAQASPRQTKRQIWCCAGTA